MITPSLLLLISPLTVSQVTLPDRVELLVRLGDPSPFIDSSGTQWYYERFLEGMRSTAEGGWSMRALIRRDDPLRTGIIVIGQDGDALDGPVEGFLVPDFDQPDPPVVREAARTGQQTAWVDNANATGAPSELLHLDDEAILSRFEPVAGAPGWTWERLDDVRATSDGSLFVTGRAFEPSIGNPQVVLANLTKGEMLLNGFDFIPGLNRRLDGLVEWKPSLDGAHWVAEAELRNSFDTVLVVDGEAYAPEPGFPLMTSAPLAPGIEARVGAGTWRFFFSYDVNSSGDVLVDAFVEVGGADQRVHLLNGEVIWTELDGLYTTGITDEGAVITSDGQRLFNMESGVVSVASPGAMVDVDRDGVIDPLFKCRTFEEAQAPLTAGPLSFVGRLLPPSGVSELAVFRARPLLIGSVACAGEPNSTGQVGSLMAVGSSVAYEADLSLEVFRLPIAARGYALFSRATGTPFIPPGSEGSICLSGSIGRLQSGLFLTGVTGRSRIVVDLTALPQPTASVAATAGETWYAQAWHRDMSSSGPTSNFTSAIQVSFD